jgi:hypothetical protein
MPEQESMSSSFSCESCQKSYRWKPELAGKKVRCKCGHTMRVPQTLATEQAEPERDEYDLKDPFSDMASLGRGTPVDEPVFREPPTVARSLQNPAAASAPTAYGTAYTPPARKKAGFDLGAIFAGGLNKNLLIGVGTIILAIGLAGFCYWQQTRHDAFMKVAKQTTGTIVSDIEVTKSGRGMKKYNPDNWTFDFEVGYTVDGQSYRSAAELHGNSLPGGWDPEASQDWRNRTLAIFYDPSNPNIIEASAEAEGKHWWWGYIAALVFVGAGGWRILKGNTEEA